MNLQQPHPVATVFLIEDDPDQRESLSAVLNRSGYRTIAFDSAEQFIQYQPNERQPGCLLLDFLLSGRDGLSFLHHHREDFTGVPVVVLTGHADVATAVKFMKAGASSLLLKPYDMAELLQAIRQAVEWDARTLPARIKMDHVRRCRAKLTERQRQIKGMVLSGSPNKVIASQLQVSERTVELERAWILKLFDVKNAIELAVLIAEAQARIDPLHSYLTDPPHKLQTEPAAELLPADRPTATG